MKTLSRFFFCIFTVALFYSCEPEEMPMEPVGNNEEIAPTEIFGDTGNQGDVIDDKKN